MGDSTEAQNESSTLNSGPSRSEDLSKTLPENAFNQLLQGKRSILVQDYSSAVSSLATACELYTNHYGELAVECAEVHFLYGKALFRLSQQNAGVLGGAINEDGDDDDEEEEEEEQEQGEESKESESDKNESENENIVTEEKDPSEPTDSPQGDPVEETPKDATQEEKTEKNEAENDNTEAEEDLEVAWNCLETAKSIFIRQGTDNKEAQLKIAEILQLLAEISMESDNNVAAIADLKESLKIAEQHRTPDDRILAETYYQMGLALMLDKQYHEALEHFSRTEEILELRIQNLKNTPSDKEAGSWADIDRQKEIEELEGVVADIKEKAEDTRELITSAKKDLEECISKKEKLAEGKEAQVESSESISKPISNITHLLKRKKPEEGHIDTDAKRIKISTGVQNGDSKVTE